MNYSVILNMMYKIVLLYLMCAIKEVVISGQAIISDQCQSHAATINDLEKKFRQLENRQKTLEDELRQTKTDGKLTE